MATCDAGVGRFRRWRQIKATFARMPRRAWRRARHGSSSGRFRGTSYVGGQVRDCSEGAILPQFRRASRRHSPRPSLGCASETNAPKRADPGSALRYRDVQLAGLPRPANEEAGHSWANRLVPMEGRRRACNPVISRAAREKRGTVRLPCDAP